MNYWMLQVNPKKFDILGWLGDFKWCHDKTLVDCWHISWFAKKVELGDTVLIWKSKGRSDIRGIYAKGKLEPLPERFPLADMELHYFIGEEGKAEKRRLDSLAPIAVRYTKLYLNKPLLSDTIKKVSELQGLTILAEGEVHSRGIHRLTIEQGRIIESLLG
jgi:hypothetical protein